MTNLVNTIINGDCLRVLPQLDAGSVDFALTDPPYFVRYRDRAGRTIRNDDRQSGQVLDAFKDVYRILKTNSLCVSFYGWNRVVHARRSSRLQQNLRLRTALPALRPRIRLCAG